ncbi:unnamed protein product [Chrysoparadoxa australica]
MRIGRPWSLPFGLLAVQLILVESFAPACSTVCRRHPNSWIPAQHRDSLLSPRASRGRLFSTSSNDGGKTLIPLCLLKLIPCSPYPQSTEPLEEDESDLPVSDSETSAAQSDASEDTTPAATQDNVKRKESPTFTGKKEILAVKIAEGEYKFIETPANKGNGWQGGGFDLGDGDGEMDMAKRALMERETQLVETVAMDKVFLGGLAGLVALLGFYAYVGFSGGISDANTRFGDMPMPTTDQGPPRIPAPGDEGLTR